MGQKERDAGSKAGSVSWPAPNSKMRPDPAKWAWIQNMPRPYVEPKGRWNAAGGWIEKK